MQGRSLIPVLKGQTPRDWRSSFYYQYFEYPVPHHVRPHYGVVTDRYKLVHFDGLDLEEWELFDLEKDPHELRSVYSETAYMMVTANLKASLPAFVPNSKYPRVFPKKLMVKLRVSRRAKPDEVKNLF